MMVDASMPGAEILAKGTRDLEESRLSPESLVLLAAAPRLRRLGLSIPSVPLQRAAELELYDALCASGVRDPFSAYNALLRRIVSLAAALEHRESRLR